MTEAPTFVRRMTEVLRLKCLSCDQGHVHGDMVGDGRLTCSACQAEYPVRKSVPLMIKPQALLDQIARIKENLSIQYIPDQAMVEVLGAAAQFAYTRPGMGVEFGNLLGRFSNFLDVAPDASDAPVAADSKLVATTAMLDPSFLPGEETTRSIRFRNTTDTIFTSEGEHPWRISYHLYDVRGKVLEFDGRRSVLPIPLPPGAELTVPVNVALPSRPGAYRIDICLVQEAVAWHTPIVSVDVTVAADTGRIAKPAVDPTAFDYPKDFLKSVEFVRTALEANSQAKILELACGLYPVSAHLVPQGALVTAVDLCWAELQMGSLIHNRPHSNIPVQFICADVDALPLEDESFDALVICAALHHFPDPVATLTKVRRHLKPGGVLVIVREPSSVDVTGEAYLADLRCGYNEQQFLFEEYMAMLAKAGFAYRYAQIDFQGSLKFAAVRQTLPHEGEGQAARGARVDWWRRAQALAGGLAGRA